MRIGSQRAKKRLQHVEASKHSMQQASCWYQQKNRQDQPCMAKRKRKTKGTNNT